MEARGVEICRKLQLAGQEHCDDVQVLFNLVEPGIVTTSNAAWAVSTKTVLVKGICGCGKPAQAPREFSAGTYVPSAGEELARIALPQWRNAALGTVASSYLKVFICEHELLYNVAEVVREIQARPNLGSEADNLLLAWLDSLLESLQAASAARSVYTLTQAALLIGRILLDRANGDDVTEPRADHLHLGILRSIICHPGVHACGILAILQPPARLLPRALELLQCDPALGLGWLNHEPPSGSSRAISDLMDMTSSVLSQLPWDAAAQLPDPVQQGCLLPSLTASLESLGSFVTRGGLSQPGHASSAGPDSHAAGAPAKRAPTWEAPSRLLLVLARTTLLVGRTAGAHAATVSCCARVLGWLPSPVRAATAPLLCSLPLAGPIGTGVGAAVPPLPAGVGIEPPSAAEDSRAGADVSGGVAALADVGSLDHALVQLLVVTLGLWQPSLSNAASSSSSSPVPAQGHGASQASLQQHSGCDPLSKDGRSAEASLGSSALSDAAGLAGPRAGATTAAAGTEGAGLVAGSAPAVLPPGTGRDGHASPGLEPLSMDTALALLLSHVTAPAHDKTLPREWLAARCLEECSLLTPALRAAAAAGHRTGAAGQETSDAARGDEADDAFPSLRLLVRVADTLMSRLDRLAHADLSGDATSGSTDDSSGGPTSSGLDAATMAELVGLIIDELAHLALFWGVDPGTRFNIERGQAGGHHTDVHLTHTGAGSPLAPVDFVGDYGGDAVAGDDVGDMVSAHPPTSGTPLAVSTSPVEDAFDEASQRVWMGQQGPGQGGQGSQGGCAVPGGERRGGQRRVAGARQGRAGTRAEGDGGGHPARRLQVPALDPVIHEAAARHLSHLCHIWPVLVGHVLATVSRHAGAYALGAWPSDRVLALVTALPLRRWHPFATDHVNIPSTPDVATDQAIGGVGKERVDKGGCDGLDHGRDVGESREGRVAADWFSKCRAGGLLGLLVMAGVAPEVVAQLRASAVGAAAVRPGPSLDGPHRRTASQRDHGDDSDGDAPPWGTLAAWAQVATRGVSYEGAARMGGGYGGDGPARVASVVIMSIKFCDLVAAVSPSSASLLSSVAAATAPAVSLPHRAHALMLLAAGRHVVPRDWWLQALLGRGRGQALCGLSVEELAHVTGKAGAAARLGLRAWLRNARWVACLSHDDDDGGGGAAAHAGRGMWAGRVDMGFQGAASDTLVATGGVVEACRLSGLPPRSLAEVEASAQLWDLVRAVATLGLVQTAVSVVGADASCLGTVCEALGLRGEGVVEPTATTPATLPSSSLGPWLLEFLHLFDLLESVLLPLARRRLAEAATGAGAAPGGGARADGSAPLGERDMLLVLGVMQLLFRTVRSVLVPAGVVGGGRREDVGSGSQYHDVDNVSAAFVTRVARILRLCLELGEDAALLPIRHRVARSLGDEGGPLARAASIGGGTGMGASASAGAGKDEGGRGATAPEGGCADGGRNYPKDTNYPGGGASSGGAWSEARLWLHVLTAAMMLGGKRGAAPSNARAGEGTRTQQEPLWVGQHKADVDEFFLSARHGVRALLPDLLNDLAHGLYAAAGGPWVFGAHRPAPPHVASPGAADSSNDRASWAPGHESGASGSDAGGYDAGVAEALLRRHRAGGSNHWLAVMGLHLEASRWWPARDLRAPPQSQTPASQTQAQATDGGGKGGDGEGLEGVGSGQGAAGSSAQAVAGADLDDLLATTFTCQEMAMRLGQHPAALPLWEEFGVCFGALLASEADPSAAAAEPVAAGGHAVPTPSRAATGVASTFDGAAAQALEEGLSPPTPSAEEGLEEPLLLDLGPRYDGVGGGGGGDGVGGGGVAPSVADDGRTRMSALADDPFSDVGTSDGTFVLQDPDEMSPPVAAASPAVDPLAPTGASPLPPAVAGRTTASDALPQGAAAPLHPGSTVSPVPAAAPVMAVAGPPRGTYRAILETPDVVEHLQILASFWGAYSAPLGDLCERMARFDFPRVPILSGDVVAFKSFREVAPPRLVAPRRESADGGAGGEVGLPRTRVPQGRASEELIAGTATVVMAADSVKGGDIGPAAPRGVSAGQEGKGDLLVDRMLPKRVGPIPRAACEAGARLPQYLALRERVQGAARDLVAWAGGMSACGGGTTPRDRARSIQRAMEGAVAGSAQGGESQGGVTPGETGDAAAAHTGAELSLLDVPVVLPPLVRSLHATLAQVNEFSHAVAECDARLLRLVRSRYAQHSTIVTVRLCCAGERGVSSYNQPYVVPCQNPNLLPVEHPEAVPLLDPAEYERQFAACRCAARDLLLRLLDGPVQALGFLCFELDLIVRWLLHHASDEKGLTPGGLAGMRPAIGSVTATGDDAGSKPVVRDKGKGKATVEVVDEAVTADGFTPVGDRAPPTPDALAAAELFFGLLEVAVMPTSADDEGALAPTMSAVSGSVPAGASVPAAAHTAAGDGAPGALATREGTRAVKPEAHAAKGAAAAASESSRLVTRGWARGMLSLLADAAVPSQLYTQEWLIGRLAQGHAWVDALTITGALTDKPAAGAGTHPGALSAAQPRAEGASGSCADLAAFLISEHVLAPHLLLADAPHGLLLGGRAGRGGGLSGGGSKSGAVTGDSGEQGSSRAMLLLACLRGIALQAAQAAGTKPSVLPPPNPPVWLAPGQGLSPVPLSAGSPVLEVGHVVVTGTGSEAAGQGQVAGGQLADKGKGMADGSVLRGAVVTWAGVGQEQLARLAAEFDVRALMRQLARAGRLVLPRGGLAVEEDEEEEEELASADGGDGGQLGSLRRDGSQSKLLVTPETAALLEVMQLLFLSGPPASPTALPGAFYVHTDQGPLAVSPAEPFNPAVASTLAADAATGVGSMGANAAAATTTTTQQAVALLEELLAFPELLLPCLHALFSDRAVSALAAPHASPPVAAHASINLADYGVTQDKATVMRAGHGPSDAAASPFVSARNGPLAAVSLSATVDHRHGPSALSGRLDAPLALVCHLPLDELPLATLVRVLRLLGRALQNGRVPSQASLAPLVSALLATPAALAVVRGPTDSSSLPPPPSAASLATGDGSTASRAILHSRPPAAGQSSASSQGPPASSSSAGGGSVSGGQLLASARLAEQLWSAVRLLLAACLDNILPLGALRGADLASGTAGNAFSSSGGPAGPAGASAGLIGGGGDGGEGFLSALQQADMHDLRVAEMMSQLDTLLSTFLDPPALLAAATTASFPTSSPLDGSWQAGTSSADATLTLSTLRDASNTMVGSSVLGSTPAGSATPAVSPACLARLWHLYESLLQPFLLAAATASGDPPSVYALFSRHWRALPWDAWRPPCVDPEGLSVSMSAAAAAAEFVSIPPSSDTVSSSSSLPSHPLGSWGDAGELATVVARLRSHLLHEDGAVMHLMERLPWHSLVEALVPSRRDGEAALGDVATPQNTQQVSALALQLSLLVINAYIRHGPKHLPAWMRRLLRREGGGADIAGKDGVLNDDDEAFGVGAGEGGRQGSKGPHLRDLLWLCDAAGLARLLEKGELVRPLLEGSGGIPGDPGPRLVHVLACLTEAALERPWASEHAPSCPGRAATAGKKPTNAVVTSITGPHGHAFFSAAADQVDSSAIKRATGEHGGEVMASRSASRRQCVELALAAALGARSLMFASITAGAGAEGRRSGTWGGGGARKTRPAGARASKAGPPSGATHSSPAGEIKVMDASRAHAVAGTVDRSETTTSEPLEASSVPGGMPASSTDGFSQPGAFPQENEALLGPSQHKGGSPHDRQVATTEGDDSELPSPSSCLPVWHLDGNLHAHLVSAVLIPLANTCLPCSRPAQASSLAPPGDAAGDDCQDALRRRLLELLLTCGEVMPRDPLRAAGHLPFGNDVQPLCAPYEFDADGVGLAGRASPLAGSASSASSGSSLDQALSAKASQLKAFFKRHIGGGGDGGSITPEEAEKKKVEAELLRRRQAGGFLGYKPREEASAECVRIQAGVAALVSHFCRAATPALALALCRIAVGPGGRLLADDSVMAARVLEEALRALFSSVKVSGDGSDASTTAAVEALGGGPLGVVASNLSFPSTREAELFAEVCEHQRLGLSLAVTLEWMRLRMESTSAPLGGGGVIDRMDSWRGTDPQWLAAAVLVGKKATSFQPDPLRPFDILPVWFVYLSFVGDRRFQDSFTSTLHTEAMAQFVDRQRQLACSLLDASTSGGGTGALATGGSNVGGGVHLGRTSSDASRTSEALFVSTAPGGSPVDSVGARGAAASAATAPSGGGRFIQGLKQAFSKPTFRSGSGGGASSSSTGTGKGKDTAGVAVGMDGQPLVTAGGTSSNLFGNFASAAAAWGGRLSSAAALTGGGGQGGGLLGRTGSGGEGKGRGGKDRRLSVELDLAEDGLMDTCLKLAAFAVGAYVHCVLCPPLGSLSALDLGPRPGAADGGATGGGLSRPSSQKRKDGNASGSNEEPLLMELDQLLETRVELDALNQLKHVKTVAASPEHFEAYFQAMEEVLSSATDLTTFKIRLATSLFPMAPYIASCAL